MVHLRRAARLAICGCCTNATPGWARSRRECLDRRLRAFVSLYASAVVRLQILARSNGGAFDARPLLARHTVAVLAADLGLSKKCLVCDLDNTCGSVLGEDVLNESNSATEPAGKRPSHSGIHPPA